MARSIKGRRRFSSRQFRSTPYRLPSFCQRAFEMAANVKKVSKASEKKDWEDATCSVCMEYPHNAVLLLCSSHDNGCRPYMCGTSYRHSNCLDQFKKAYTKVLPPENQDSAIVHPLWPAVEKSEATELTCPLCRGQVKGWTIVEPAREYLNMKKRSCVQDDCSFMGTYKELRKHVRAEHTSAKPHEVDPVLEQKWRLLEHERERNDVISTVMSSMPGAMVLGDYVIEGNDSGSDTDEEERVGGDGNHGGRGSVASENLLNFLLFMHSFQNSGSSSFTSRLRRAQRGGVRAYEGHVGHFSSDNRTGQAGGSQPNAAAADDEAPIFGQGRGPERFERQRLRRRRRSGGRSGIDVT